MRRHALTSFLLVLVALFLPAVALASGDEHGAHGFDWTTNGWYIIDFVALVAVLIWMEKKWKITKVFFKVDPEAKRAKMEQEATEAATMFEEAVATYDEFSGRIDNLDKEKERIREKYREEGRIEQGRIVEEAKEKAASIVKDAQREVEFESRRREQELVSRLGAMALDKAEATLVETLDSTRQVTLIDGFLDELEKAERPAGLDFQ